MDPINADLLFHPVRMRILQALALEELATQEISQRLPDVPTSSIYRHLKILLDGALVVVTETRPVRGVEEKVYGLTTTPHLGDDALDRLSKEDFLRLFSAFVLSLQAGFANYVAAVEAESPATLAETLRADRMGFSTRTLYATPTEIDAFLDRVAQAAMELTAAGPGAGRRQYELALITHPMFAPVQQESNADEAG